MRRLRRSAGRAARSARRLHRAATAPLGAGKTTFVRHLLRALGVQRAHQEPDLRRARAVRAAAACDASHFDFYRFDDPREWEDAGFRDVFAQPGLKLAEWPEKAAGLLPAADLRLCIDATHRRRARRARCTPRRRAAWSCSHDAAANDRGGAWLQQGGALVLLLSARRARLRRQHRRGARLAGRRLHARDDRVRRGAGGQALHWPTTRRAW